MRWAWALALGAVACSSTSSVEPATDSGSADDAIADAATDAGHPVTSAFGATFAPTQLRASSGGLAFLVNGTGSATKDFAGDTATVNGVTLFHTSLEGKTSWTFPTCLAPGVGSIDALPSGEAVVVGSFATTCTMGGTTLESAGDEDAFVARLDAKGAAKWIQRFGGAGLDRATLVRLDPSGNAIVAGTTSGADATSLPVGPDAGELLAKIDPDAKVVWFKQFNGTSYKIATGSKGEIVFFGSLLDGTDFGGGPIPRPTTEALAIVDMNADGSVKWSRVITFARLAGIAPTIPVAGDVAVDDAGNVWFAARFGGLSVDFGKGVETPADPTQLSLLVGRLDPTGAPAFGVLQPGGAEVRLATGAGKGFLLSRARPAGKDQAYAIAYGVDGSIAWRTEIGTASVPSGIGFDGTSVRAMGTFDEDLDFGSTKLVAPGAFLLAWPPRE
jgi:hypothetical protein